MLNLHNLPSLEQLRLFGLVFEERNLTRAARKLGLSQPATSRAIAKLRECFADPLFVKTRTGMQPTPRAEVLAPSIQQVLDSCRALLEPQHFAPQHLKRIFTIATGDFGEVSLLPRIAAKISDVAPHVDIVTRPVPSDLPVALASGKIDIAVGVFANVPADTMRQHLFDDHFVCAVRRNHPELSGRITLQKFAALPHVLIAPGGEPGGAVDRALALHNLTRRVQIRLSSFVAAPLLISQTDLILTGPALVIEPLAEMLSLHLFAPPLKVPGFSVHQVWHSRFQSDPAHAWFRGVIAEAARGRQQTYRAKSGSKKGR